MFREKFHAKIQAPVKTDGDHQWEPGSGLTEGKGQASVRPASGRQLPEREKLLLTRHEKRLPTLSPGNLAKIKPKRRKSKIKREPAREGRFRQGKTSIYLVTLSQQVFSTGKKRVTGTKTVI